MGFVYPLLTGGLGAMGLFVAISVHTDPLDIFISILLSGFFWLLFLLVLREIPQVLTKTPRIVIDREGITDNRRRETLTIPWDDILAISFPRGPRYSYVLSIDLKNPEFYNHKIPWLYSFNKRLSSYSGDFTISFYNLKADPVYVYTDLMNLQHRGEIPSTFHIREPN